VSEHVPSESCLVSGCLEEALTLMTVGAQMLLRHREFLESLMALAPDLPHPPVFKRFLEIAGQVAEQVAERDAQLAAMRRSDDSVGQRS
jgi:hypothetical protein